MGHHWWQWIQSIAGKVTGVHGPNILVLADRLLGSWIFGIVGQTSIVWVTDSMKMTKIMLILENATCTSYYDDQKSITDHILYIIYDMFHFVNGLFRIIGRSSKLLFKWVKLENFWILETAEIDFSNRF